MPAPSVAGEDEDRCLITDDTFWLSAQKAEGREGSWGPFGEGTNTLDSSELKNPTSRHSHVGG